MQSKFLFALALGGALAATAAATAAPLDDARALLAGQARVSGHAAYSPRTAVKFKATDHVFVTSALAVDFTYRAASVTLPLYEGRAPDGTPVHYILTEASDFATARALGVNYAPKLAYASGSAGASAGTLEEGLLHFAGTIDFTPTYAVAPGKDRPFPPSVATPGAVGDANYSSIVTLPSGVVINAQIVHNATGSHDRLKSIDLQNRTVTLSLLDGFHNGRQYFYHLVTDVSADVPSVLEKGVYAPRLAALPTFGTSTGKGSALLGFSPVLNGRTVKDSGQEQGFEASLSNGGIDPINVFPLGPDNRNGSQANNYSPLWDAHVSQWTAAAIAAGKVRRITSLADLTRLVRAGDVESAFINPAGTGNPFVAGLRPTRAIINCPVIAQPELPSR